MHYEVGKYAANQGVGRFILLRNTQGTGKKGHNADIHSHYLKRWIR